MKKICLTSVLALTIATPALTDNVQLTIATNANSADCAQPVLGTTSGTSNLEANWSANTLNIDWYDGDTKITSTTCTYDGGITIPSDDPEKTGYTFNGWTIRRAAAAPAQTEFDLSTLVEYVSMTGIQYAHITPRGKKSEANTSNYITIPETYGLTENGTWATEFNYGTVYGESYCSGKSGDNNSQNWDNDSSNWLATDEEVTGTSGSSNCWCKITGFVEPNSSSLRPVVTARWVFVSKIVRASCDLNCKCGYNAMNKAAFRRAVFGVAE